MVDGISRSPDDVDWFTEKMLRLEESSVYQAIFQRGFRIGFERGYERGRRLEVHLRFLKRVGTRKFGNPTSAVIARLDSMQELERLEAIEDRLWDVSTWDELLSGL